jgi:hypothetical protein
MQRMKQRPQRRGLGVYWKAAGKRKRKPWLTYFMPDSSRVYSIAFVAVGVVYVMDSSEEFMGKLRLGQFAK